MDPTRCKSQRLGRTKRGTIYLLNSLAGEVVGSCHELVKASGKIQGRAGQVTTRLAGEQSMSLQRHPHLRTGHKHAIEQDSCGLLLLSHLYLCLVCSHQPPKVARGKLLYRCRVVGGGMESTRGTVKWSNRR